MLFDDNNVNLDLALFNLSNLNIPQNNIVSKVNNMNLSTKFLTAKEGFFNIFRYSAKK